MKECWGDTFVEKWYASGDSTELDTLSGEVLGLAWAETGKKNSLRYF